MLSSVTAGVSASPWISSTPADMGTVAWRVHHRAVRVFLVALHKSFNAMANGMMSVKK